jgi:hypothetical protein
MITTPVPLIFATPPLVTAPTRKSIAMTETIVRPTAAPLEFARTFSFLLVARLAELDRAQRSIIATPSSARTAQGLAFAPLSPSSAMMATYVPMILAL